MACSAAGVTSIIPHELVPFEPADLRAKQDSLIRRAEALLAAFPQDKVRYDSQQHGWSGEVSR